MSRMKGLTNGKNFSLRAIVSTLVGESADSLIFFPMAFAGLIPFTELLKMMCVQAILKTVYEIIILPLTIVVVRYVKRTEGVDTYDRDISYNVFKVEESV